MRRERQAGGIEVRGRKTELAPQAIASRNDCGQGISAAKHLAGIIQIAGSNRLPNPRAADRLAIERNRGEAMDGEVQFCSKLLEQLDITAAFVAKDKICTDANALDQAKVTGQAANKGFARLLAEAFIEVKQ
jgi:hypothetical protein